MDIFPLQGVFDLYFFDFVTTYKYIHVKQTMRKAGTKETILQDQTFLAKTYQFPKPCF